MLNTKFHNIIKCFIKSSNVRYASEILRKDTKETRDTHHSFLSETFNGNPQPTKQEWTDLRNNLLKMKSRSSVVNANNVDVFILSNCLPKQLETGKSYVKYLKESGSEPKISALMRLLKLYFDASRAGIPITKEDQQYIVDMYNRLAAQYEIFDSTLGEGLLHGLVLTDEWRKSLDIMDSMKFCSNPSSSAYSAVIGRALHEGDESLGWNLFNDMIANCTTTLRNEAFESYIHFCEKNNDEFEKNINKMLTFIRDNEILITDKIARAFQRAFEKFDYNCSITTVNPRGKCESCKQHLPNVHITDEELGQLSDHFLNKVLVGRDIFTKSTPEEFQTFIRFMDKTIPYDCVIDGLNVAYSLNTNDPVKRSKALASVVKHFADQKMKILVVGRKHMERWPQMDYTNRNAKLFLTDNLSQDDPYFLYSTLKSGPNTIFVTRDLIRNHAFKLDLNLKRIFRKWQQLRQHSMQRVWDSGHVIFHEKIEFDMSAHLLKDHCCHIPFNNDAFCTLHQDYLELRENWLCVSKKTMAKK
ncbi:Mitochondrial ribonuclease P catalytic subunit [Pseudolycoriella hygida]|uniref:Mitochondrial ribonuclease P catalytic subunit n=1 Tax=Pseudolycoriella hygida TaxID=35572 RepID=A0A9Q0MMX5_9DIPT|nr:Mitochondrial ribonuclease P catalytic subunit [Pseudolycoriella hygida]